jgi:ABC-type sulfate/molybdate transport systems ATPase subunit
MPEIVLSHVTKRWDKFYAVDDLSMTIENNAFVTLLGPSGCGKTAHDRGPGNAHERPHHDRRQGGI